MDEALRLERSLVDWPLEDGPDERHGASALVVGRRRRARGRSSTRCDRAVQGRGDVPGRGGCAVVPRARRVAGGKLGGGRPLRQRLARSWRHRSAIAAAVLRDYPVAIVDAHLGRVDDARARAEAAIAHGRRPRACSVVEAGFSWVLGSSSSSRSATLRRRFPTCGAHTRLDATSSASRGCASSSATSSRRSSRTDALDEAERAPGARGGACAERSIGPGRSRSSRAAAALLLAARGDLDGRVRDASSAALAEHARVTDPFQHARTLLALGRTQRRAKRRGAARTTLEDALARFETLGAPLWAEQTRAELARIGGRAASRGELTEAERRIALLVAEGRRNREVAAELFLTEHSVETALSRIYRKLGIRSRGELGARAVKQLRFPAFASLLSERASSGKPTRGGRTDEGYG